MFVFLFYKQLKIVLKNNYENKFKHIALNLKEKIIKIKKKVI
jgi:hypothetical protein